MPLPEPFPPFATATQLVSGDPDHTQPGGAMTLMLPLPPADENTAPAEASEYVHTPEASKVRAARTAARAVSSAALVRLFKIRMYQEKPFSCDGIDPIWLAESCWRKLAG